MGFKDYHNLEQSYRLVHGRNSIAGTFVKLPSTIEVISFRMLLLDYLIMKSLDKHKW